MSKEKSRIVSEAIEYLNFIKKYNSFPLFNDGLIVEDILKRLEIIKADESTVIDEIYKTQLTVTEDKVSDKRSEPDSISEKPKVIEINNIQKTESDMSINFTAGLNGAQELQGYKNLDDLNSLVCKCTKCSLLSQQRSNVVFGSGDINADLVIVGEAPGAEEDKQGLPFVGRAGKLLTDILKAINFSREEVYICNILKCRPPENRNPMPDEINNCEPYLFTQLKIIKPKLILALGTFASQTLLRSKEPLGKLRGRFHTYEGIKMMVTYHPAALLRNPNWKKPTWEDVKMLRAEYDKMKMN